jgi:hypothetical protein
MATNDELLARVYSILGPDRDTSIMKPLVLAMATLAYRELAIRLIDTDSELAKKLITSAVNQAWATSQFSAPANMLFHNQRKTTRIVIDTDLAYQVKDRDTLGLLNTTSGSGIIYYALEGKTFFISHPSAVNGNDLNITYYKIPTIADIDSELMNPLLEILIPMLGTHNEPNDRQEKSSS